MARRTGPLARLNLFRLSVFGIILVTAVLAFTLQVGVFRFLFRGALVVGIVILFGSYFVGWWITRRQAKRS